MMVDAFTPNAFKLRTLTAAITNLPYKPSLISDMGIFEEAGISTLTAAVESDNGVLRLLDVKARGASGTPISGSNRTMRPFIVPHIPARAQILADEVQGVRAFGSDSNAEVLTTKISERMQTMRNSIDYTIESHRLAAIMGNFIDSNNASISLYTTFGVSQTTISFELDVTTTLLRQIIMQMKEVIEAALGGLSYSGITVLCGSTFWQQLIEHKSIKDTVLNTQLAKDLRGDPTDTLDFAGCHFVRYRGTSAVKVPDTEAYAIPTGVSGLFITRFAPANYNETVNTNGLPYYAKGEPMDMGKGWDLEAQSNPLNIGTRPASVIKLTNT